MKRELTLLALVTILVVAAPVPAPASLCGVADIAIFAFNSIQVSRDATVTGDVVANSESPGPVLDEGAEVALDRNSMVAGNVKGHTIDLDSGSTIDGDATYVELTNQGTITGAQTIGAPPYTDVPEFQAASAGGDDVTANPGETVVLGDEGFCSITVTMECVVDSDCPGGETCTRTPVTAYGDIVLNGGTVVFSGGGSFDVESISGDGDVEFDAPTDLRVAGRVHTEAGSYIGPEAGSGIAASDIVLYVGGSNGGAGGPADDPPAVNVGQSSDIQANIYAPNGTIEIDKNSAVTGALLGLDVKVNRATVVTLDSAFENEAPTAVAQDVITDGATDLVITLEGSDPEGGDLSFSIEVGPDPLAGSIVSGPTAINPAPAQQCSQSGVECTIDANCPGFGEGETCDTVQPPITQATVTYRPNATNCTTDPESGEVTCSEDFFTFGVTDDCDDLATAVVSVNGGTNEVPDDPGTGVDAVEAEDQEADLVVNQVVTLTLGAAAPNPPVASLTFRVETLPTGALQDSDGFAVVAGVDLPSPVLTYQAPATAGSDSFTFSARDSATGAPPCGPPSCDTGTVNIDIGTLPELAPDQSAETDLNTPVEVTLRANAGGSGTGGGQAQGGGAMSLTYGDNGPPLTKSQADRLAERGGGPAQSIATRSTALGVDQGWQQFGWCDTNLTPGCDDLVDLEVEVEVIESPFDFTTTEASCLRVTDTLAKGDHWRVEADFGGSPDWTDFTSEVAQSTVGTTTDPDVAFGDLSYSHGEFDLVGSGGYSVRLFTIPPDSFAFGTAGYIRVDTGPCVDIVWTITSLPTNGTLTNLDGSLVQSGDTYVSEPTVVYTPLFNVSGPDSFTYEVEQGGTIGTGVLDSAIVDLLVSSTDPCVLVGRDPGCAPGGGGSAQGGSDSAQPELDEESSDGLTFIVEGEGSVVSSPVEMEEGRVLTGLLCTRQCTKRFPIGALVSIQARPDPGYEFVRWSGACGGDEAIGTLRLSKQTVCTATFRKKDGD